MKLTDVKWLKAALVALVCTGLLVGCGDDSKSDPDTSSDATTDMAGDTPGDAPGDVPVGDTPGDTPPGDMGMDVIPGMPIDITWPTDPNMYMASNASYLHTLTIPPGVGGPDDGPTCCRDWGPISRDFIMRGTNKNDNALAALAMSLGGLGDFNLQDTLTETIQDGTFAIIWDHQEFNGMATDDDGFVLAGLFGEPTAEPFDYAAAAAGNGTFNINPSSFKPGTGEPLINFNPASMTNGAMMAGPSNFILTFPLGLVTLQVTVSETVVVATGTPGANGVGYTGGTLTGYVLYEDLVQALNDFVGSGECDCLGLSGPLYTFADGEVTANQCMSPDAAAMACPMSETCATLAGGLSGIPVCTLLPSIVEGVTDLDIDGNCESDPDNCDYEALSVGLGWEAAPATMEGVAAP